MDEITQSDNPIITDPTVLTEDAMKATDSSLLSRLSNAPPAPPTTTGPKRRGRPPGTKNKPKLDENGQVVSPRATRGKYLPPLDSDKIRKDRLDSKKKSAEKWQKKISDEANELLMDALIGFGVPEQLLYINPPVRKRMDSNYTPLAQALAIKPNHAKVWGMTIAELEGSDFGSRAADVITGDSPIRLIGLCVASAAMGFQYVNGILKIKEQLQPMIDALQANKKAASHKTKEGNE